jgi:hypothetical protein
LPIVGLTVYSEHCPLRLSRIYEMIMAQALYLLK